MTGWADGAALRRGLRAEERGLVLGPGEEGGRVLVLVPVPAVDAPDGVVVQQVLAHLVGEVQVLAGGARVARAVVLRHPPGVALD